MAVIKLSPENIHKNDGSSKIKLDRSRISVDSARVSGYETRNKESYDALEKYRQRINSGGYLSADDLTEYRKALDSYVETSTSLRGISKALGQGKDDDQKWTETIAQMESGYQGISDYFSQWKTEDAFKASLAAQKDRDEKLKLDTTAYRSELDALEAQRDALVQELDAADSSIGTENVDRAAMDLVGRIDALEKQIQEKKLYLSEAERLQEGVRLSSVSGSEDFDAFNDYVSTEFGDGISWDKLFNNQYGLGYEDLTYEYINNQNDARSKINRKLAAYSHGASTVDNVFEEKGYNLMYEDEIAIYNYYYAKEGKAAAEKYLNSIQETLSSRKAEGIAKGLEDNFLLEMAFGVVAGIDQFSSGVEGLVDSITGNDQYKAPSATQMASGMVREDLSDVDLKWYNFKDKAWGDAKIFGNSLGQAAYDSVTTTSNMLPSILTSAAVNFVAPGAGSYVGTTLLGASAGGNAYREMINLGYDKGQARAYAAMVGGSEAIMQSLLGGISSLSGGGTEGIFQSIAGKLLPHVDKAFARTAIKLGANMLDEGLEEGLQEILNPWFQNLALNANAKVNWSEVAYSSLLGALTAGIMEGPGTVYGEVNAYTQGKKLLKSDFSAQRLAELGKTFAADTEAYQLAGKVNENTGAYTIGRLFNAIGATMTEQNVNDITNALVAKGWDEVTARKNAEALAYVVEGGQLTDKQTAIIEANEGLAEVARSVLIDANSTVNQRTKGYNEALMALAQEKSGAKSSLTNPAQQSEENAPADGTVDATKENGVESASEADTGPAKVKSIASIKNKRATVALEDGTEADVKDVDLDPNDGVRIETIASIDGISATDANFIFKTLRENTGASAQMDALGAKDAYRYGFYGFSKDLMTKQAVFANSLTEAQRNAIYEVGQKARQQQIEKASPKTTAKKRGIYFDHGGGNVVEFKDADKNTLTEEKRKAGVQVALILNKLGIGGSIYFFESYRNAKGQLVYKDSTGKEVKAPNGWYSEKDGSIHIDLNAGRGGNGLVMFTLAHELTHFIEQWSPAKYKILADFLIENYEKGQSMDALIRRKQAKLSEMRGEKISYDEAYSEVIADSMEAMLADGNVLEKLIELKAKDQSLFNKMKQFFDNLLTKIRNAYKGQAPDSYEGNAVMEMTDSIERIQQLFAEALVEASENLQSAMESVVEENAKPISENEIITDGAVVTDGNGNKYSIKSMKHDIAEGQMFEDLKKYCGWTQRQVTKLKNDLEDLVAYMAPYRDILDMNETYDREGRRFSPYKPNSDPLYKISMDFSTLCSKRLLTQYVIENLQLRENRPMSAEEQLAIRDMLNEYRKVEKGLQVACAMCYVEAARLKSPNQIKKWLADPATQMKNFFADKDPEFAAFIKEKQADFKESRGYARNATKKDMKPKDVSELNKIRPRLRSQYQLSAEELEIIERAKALPNSSYLTAGNLADLSETEPVIYAAYTAFVRTATRSKSLETDEPYYYGDSTRDNGNGIVVTDSFIEAVNRENGMRFSSWSDWRIQHLLDYIAAVIDNSVRGAAMHGYTKFGEEVRVLGKTGMMFNMSGVPGSQTGLNEDGSLSFSPTESIDVNEAIQLRDQFPETAGLQCIGVSDDHIIALLRSDFVDYIIPYHVSGLNAVLRRMVNIYGWDDYTGTQHAAIDKSIKFEDAVDQEHWHEEPVYSEFFVGYDTGMTGIEAMRKSAARYVQMCKDRGLKPKFEKFVKEENYWKLLIDRKMINQKTGKLIQQKPVTPTFDFGTIKEVVDRYVKNYDSNLEARALNHIVENWDSIPQRIKDLKKQGGTKAKKTKKAVDTLANQTIAAQPKEAGTHNSDRDYSYEALTSKPDMMVTDVGGNVPKNRADVVAVAKKNAASVGRFDPKTGSVSVHVNDMDVDVLLGTDGLKHGLRRTKDAQNDANYIVTVKAGEILKNSIKVNEITPKKHNATGSYVLIGIAKNASGDMYIVRSVVNQFNNELASMDVLYAINAKKELAATKSPRSTAEPLSVTSSSISITELLDIVNQHFPDILPEDVLKHYGYDARPEGDLGENVLYSERDTDSVSNRHLLANAFEGVAQNDIEKRKIQEYKSQISLINAEERKLSELNQKIKDLSFAKGPKDTKAIRALRFEAMQTANRINTMDKILLRLEASKPLQDVLTREKEKVRKREQQKGKEALEAYREKATKTQREMLEKWQESRKKYQASKKKAIETREKREAREKLQKLVLDTAKWISYPSKTDVKCPDILKQPYADFLNGIDLSSKRLAEGGDPTKNDLRLANAMDSLATALERITDSQDPNRDPDRIASAVLDAGYLDLPADFVKELRDMTENVKQMMAEGEFVVNNMSAAEVRQLSQMIRTLNHAIKEVSRLYANLRFANVEALGDATMAFMDSLGEIEKSGGMKDFVEWDNALPYYAFKRFGNGGESIFEGLMDSQDKLAFLAQQIFDFQEKTWTEEEAKAWSEDTHTIELPSGNSLVLTTADAMSIYCLSRREHALPHLLGGGVRVMGIEKGSQKVKDSRSTLTIEDINTIHDSLTDRQKKVAEALQAFMSTTCSEWGNEISMKRFLTKEFNEKFYFPIESNDENLPTKDPAAQQSDLFRLLNISATKPLTEGANNEVIIRNVFDVFTGHASDMARLNAYGMALLDYMKWLNYREKTVNEEGQIKVRGVRKSMEKAYGKAARSYALNLIKDVNGRPSDNGDPTMLMQWMRNAKIASVGANLRVAALQFTAYPRAAMVLSTRSIALGLTKAPQITKAKKYCGIALWKSFGFYDTNIARNIEDQMKGVTNIRQKIIELSMKGAEWGDAIAWGCLWNACEYEVASTKKHKVGSEEFYQEVGKKLREVVYATQVVDSTLTRSQLMRSKRGMAQEAASFMSEPTLTANILMDARFQFEAEKRRTGSVKAAWNKAGTHIGRAVAVYSCVALLGALVESLGDAWRDDDDEEFYKKFFEAMPENILLNMLPFNKVPIVSDVFELAMSFFDIGFFSSEKLSTQWLSQTASAVDAWGDVFSGKSTATVYGALYKTVKAFSSTTGIPFSGAVREVAALWNNTAGSFNSAWKLRTYGQTQEDLRNGLYEAIVSGNQKQVESIQAEFRERADDDKDYQSTLTSAIRKALRENDPRILEAAQAVINGNGTERANIARAIAAEGHFSLQDIQAAINAEIDKLRKEAKGK